MSARLSVEELTFLLWCVEAYKREFKRRAAEDRLTSVDVNAALVQAHQVKAALYAQLELWREDIDQALGARETSGLAE